jgi:hypothetical protein
MHSVLASLSSLPRRSSLVPALALLLGGLLAVAPAARGQTALSSDRPGFSDGPTPVGPGTVQAELGYAFNTNGGDGLHEIGQLLLRAGLGSGLEVRGGVGSYLVTEGPNGYAGAGIAPAAGATLGAKARLLRSSVSSVSALATTTLPLADDAFLGGDERARQEVKLAFDGALGRNLSLTINGGARFYATGDAAAQALFIPTLNIGLNERTGAYVGYAGFYGDGPNTSYVEAGLTLLSGLDTQLDVNVGTRVDSNADEVFIGLGLAHRL